MAPEPEEEAEPEYKHTPEELARAVDQARSRAIAETEKVLRAELESDVDQRRCATLASIKVQLEQRQTEWNEQLARSAVVSQELAVALATAIVPRAIERHPLGDIVDMLRDTLSRLTAEPALEVRLPPDLAESGETMLSEIALEVGFPGSVKSVADPTMGEVDAELRWRGGAIDHRLDRIQAEALNIVDHWFSELPEAESEDETGPEAASATHTLASDEASRISDSSVATG